MFSLHLTHPSAHTLGAVGSQLCSARGAVVDFLPEPGFEPTTLGFKSNALSIRPRLPKSSVPYHFLDIRIFLSRAARTFTLVMTR